jgi:hypothetical protein
MVAFCCYDPSTDGSGGIHLWYEALAPKIRSAIDATLELMAVETTLDEHPSFKPLRGKCRGLAEIKIDIEIKDSKNPKRTHKIHVRILGPHNPPTKEFLLLTGFLKRGGPDYGPMCKQAHNRTRGVQRNEQKSKICRFP